jgi:hypothetical protein
MEVRMSPNTNASTVVTPGAPFVPSALGGQPAGGRLEWLAAIWARQTGRAIVVATPR